MQTLKQIFYSLDPSTDGASVKYDHYLDIYEQYFSPLRSKPVKILELGIEKGGSLSLWSKYFHPDSTIVGMDIVPGCAKNQRGNIKVVIGNQENTDDLNNLINFGPYDIIIDDGGHHSKQHIKSFGHLFKVLRPNGLYFVEDLHTCYMKEFQDHTQEDFITFCHTLSHLVTNPNYNNLNSNAIKEVHFYNSLVLIVKSHITRDKVTSPGFDIVPYPK